MQLYDFVRIGLTPEQVAYHHLERLAIEVKPSDSRAENYIERYGDRCWKADVLPPDIIAATIDVKIERWLDHKLWSGAMPRSRQPSRAKER